MQLDLVTKTAINDGVQVMALLAGIAFITLGSVAAMMWAARKDMDSEVRGVLAGAGFNMVLAVLFTLLWLALP